MAQKEQNIQTLITLAVSKIKGVCVFRNNTGMAHVGKVFSDRTVNGKRLVTLENPRHLHAGLCVGSSDLIGWKSMEITQDMVGKKVAIFTAIEVKTNTGKASPEQLHFMKTVSAAGGIAGVARNENEALYMVDGSYLFPVV